MTGETSILPSLKWAKSSSPLNLVGEEGSKAIRYPFVRVSGEKLKPLVPSDAIDPEDSHILPIPRAVIVLTGEK